MATKHAWLALLAALACVAVAGMEVEVDGHGLVVVEGEEVHDVKESDEEEAYVPDFEPTKEWKDILPGQAVPPGLHVRLNLATGRRQAKMMDAIHLPQANLERLARAELIEKMKAEGTLAKFRPTMADIADRGKLEDLAEIFCAVNDIEEEYCGQAVVDETRRDFGLGAKLQVEQGLVVLVDGDEQLFKPSMVEVRPRPPPPATALPSLPACAVGASSALFSSLQRHAKKGMQRKACKGMRLRAAAGGERREAQSGGPALLRPAPRGGCRVRASRLRPGLPRMPAFVACRHDRDVAWPCRAVPLPRCRRPRYAGPAAGLPSALLKGSHDPPETRDDIHDPSLSPRGGVGRLKAGAGGVRLHGLREAPPPPPALEVQPHRPDEAVRTRRRLE